MAIQLSVNARNARLDAIESTAGTSAVLKIFATSIPANCATADNGTALVTITLPSDWMNAASSGSKTLLGSWSGTASSTGTAAHFRLYNSGATTCHMQGSVTATGGGGDLILDSTSIVSGATVTVSTFTLTDANA